MASAGWFLADQFRAYAECTSAIAMVVCRSDPLQFARRQDAKGLTGLAEAGRRGLLNGVRQEKAPRVQ